MNRKFFVWIIGLMLLVTLVKAVGDLEKAPRETIKSAIDSDGDGICNWAQEDTRYTQYGDVNRFLCRRTQYGDLCPDTQHGKSVSSLAEQAGCSPDQIEAFIDYWSTKIGILIPDSVKMNWLLDQEYVKVYQPIEFTPNIVVETHKDIAIGPEITNVNFYCIGDHFSGVKKIDLDNDPRTITLEITLRRFTGSELTYQNVLDVNAQEVQNILVGRDGKSEKIREIRIGCRANIYQSEVETKVNAAGQIEKIPKRVYPAEQNEFEFFIPIENLALQPPDSALRAGIRSSQAIIDGVDSILPKVEKARKISGTICGYSVGIALASSIIKPLEKFGNWWWYGVLGTGKTYKAGVGSQTGGWIGGKAFCRYFACPTDWCPLLQETKLDPASITDKEKETYDTLIKRLEEARDKTTDVVAKENYQKSIDQLKNPTYQERINYYPKSGVASVQDSLILSVGCQCISGVELNLWRIKRIMEEWNKCLKIAEADGEYVGYCEEYLSTNICQYVAGEISALKQLNPIQKGINKISSWLSGLFGASGEQRSAAEDASKVPDKETMESEIESTKTFINNELLPVASSGYKGKLGYGDLGAVFCELALYQRVPQIDFLKRLSIEGVVWKTTITGKFNKKIAYQVPDTGAKVYDYEISWTIIAGEDNFPYTITLETDAGVTQRLLRGTGTLRNAGDIKSDYVQINDERDFTKICFDTPRDINRRHCFYEGDFREGAPLPSLTPSEKDTDGDGLPDDWEEENNNPPIGNYLDSNLEDSDGDGVKDGDEDPDEDGVSNYLEYKSGLDPNQAGVTITGGLAPTECSVKNDFTVAINGARENDFYRFNTGDRINLRLSDVQISEGNSEEDLVVLGDIENDKYAYFERFSYPLSRANSEFTLWDIPSDVKTGQYELTVSLSKPKDFYGQNICSVESTRKLAIKTFSLLIINPSETECVDSGLNRWSRGSCISNGQVYSDSCVDETLVTEYTCEDNKCVSQSLPCGLDEKCAERKCVPSTTYIPPSEKKSEVVSLAGLKIAVDAGHGVDSGAVASDGIKEGYLNWLLANDLVTVLGGSVGFNLRTNQEDMGIALRNQLVLDQRATMVISMHVNNLEGGNEVDCPNYKDFMVIYDTGSNNPDESKKLAESIANVLQENLNTETKVRTQSVTNWPGLGILKGGNKEGYPIGVLIENGYICNKNNREKLQTSTYREKIANAIKFGVIDYVQNSQPIT